MGNIKDIIVSIVCQKLHHTQGYAPIIKMGCYDVVGTLKLMPKEDQNIIEQQAKCYEELAPCVIESDFECFNIKHNTTIINNQNSYTDIITTHEPNSYAIRISISNQFENKIDEVDLESYYLYRGDNTIENFIESLIGIQENREVNQEIS